MCTSCLFGPFNRHYVIFKQAQDHRKWWRIDWPRQPPNRKCRISPECRHTSLLSLQVLQAIPEYIVNEPSMVENWQRSRTPSWNTACQISPKCNGGCLLSLQVLKLTVQYQVINPLLVGNDTELSEIHYDSWCPSGTHYMSVGASMVPIHTLDSVEVFFN